MENLFEAFEDLLRKCIREELDRAFNPPMPIKKQEEPVSNEIKPIELKRIDYRRRGPNRSKYLSIKLGREVITADQAAELIGVSRSMFYSLVNDGLIPSHGEKKSKYYFKEEILTANF